MLTKKIFFAILIAIFSFTLGFSSFAIDNLIIYADFESKPLTFGITAKTGDGVTVAQKTTDKTSGTASLEVTQTKTYGHVAYQTPLKVNFGKTYNFSYDIKIISANDGTAASNISVYTNFMFTDLKANGRKNHLINAGKISASQGWKSITGSYTFNSLVLDPAADLKNVYFSIYTNPTASNKPIVFLIDNVKVWDPSAVAAEGENMILNGDFEQLSLTMGSVSKVGSSVNATRETLDVKSGTGALKVVPNSAYGHVGYILPFSMKLGRTYKYEYDVKILYDAKGNSIDSTGVYTNFVFTDSLAQLNRNHNNFSLSAGSESGWNHVSGSYTFDGSKYAPDAALDEVYFCIYANPVSNNAVTFIIDNVSLILVAEENFTLPNVISDNMLIQQNKPISLFGTSNANGTLKAEFLNASNAVLTQKEIAVIKGQDFELSLNSLPYGGPYTINFTLDGFTKTIKNVLIGELWQFSGQSNMQYSVSGCETHISDFLPNEPIDSIRYYDGTSWKIASKESVRAMSAVAYSMLYKLNQSLSIPVGGINTSVGGQKMSAYQGVSTRYPTAGSLFNTKVSLYTKLNIAGFIWYQGESDTNNENFVEDFKSLISSWRSAWGDVNLPFIFVQLPQSPATCPDWYAALDTNGNPTRTMTYNYTNVRKWQNKVYDNLKDDNVGMVVTTDVTTHIDPQKSIENKSAEDPLHPRNKKPIGERLAMCALGMVYQKNTNYLYPKAVNLTMAGNVMTVTFNNVYDGLKTTDNLDPRFFLIQDDNGTLSAPKSVKIISATQISVVSTLPNPRTVHYFYEDKLTDMAKPFVGLDVNFVNSASFPVSPFSISLPASVSYESDLQITGILPIDENKYVSGDTFILPDFSTFSVSGFTPTYWFDGSKYYYPKESYEVGENNIQFKVIYTDDFKSTISYSAEFNGKTLEGWTVSKMTPNDDSAVKTGFASFTSIAGKTSSSDPRMTTVTNIDADTYKILKIRMANNSKSNSMIFRYKRTIDSADITKIHSSGQAIYTAINTTGEFTEYTIDLSNATNWNGTIDRIWIDPACTADGSFSIDYIRILKKGFNTIAYDANLAEANLSTIPAFDIEVPMGAGYILSNSTPVSTHYEFLGWNTDKNAKAGLPENKLDISGNMTVYAIWKIKPNFFINGDINQDGIITPFDASIILQYFAKFDTILNETNCYLADLDSNGAVGTYDASLLLQNLAFKSNPEYTNPYSIGEFKQIN